MLPGMLISLQMFLSNVITPPCHLTVFNCGSTNACYIWIIGNNAHRLINNNYSLIE